MSEYVLSTQEAAAITLTWDEMEELGKARKQNKTKTSSPYFELLDAIDAALNPETGSLVMPWELRRQVRDYAELGGKYQRLRRIFERSLGPEL